MNVKRLTILRDALIEHARNPGNLKFDLWRWVSLPRPYRKTDPTEAVCGARLGENFCGTSACAMGLAASLPEFNREGLRLTAPWEGEWEVIFDDGTDEVDGGFQAAERFFDISFEDSLELFAAGNYLRHDHKNPLAVADKITALLHTA